MSNATPIVTRRSKIYRTALAKCEAARSAYVNAEAAEYMAEQGPAKDAAADTRRVCETKFIIADMELRALKSMMA